MFRAFTASVVLTILTLMSVDFTAVAAPASVNASAKKIYMVRMRELPVAAYSGTVSGYAATRPAKGERLDARSAAAVRYSNYLRAKQDTALNAVGGARKIYSYSIVLNGFAAELTETQAAKLRATAGVVSVSENEILKLDTITTPTFLGLDKHRGIWDELGGARNAGDNVIVGIIDSGITPEHPSFAPLSAHSGPAPGWTGTCQAGEEFPATSCNNKLIGARYFIDGFGGAAEVKEIFPYEYISPRAAEAHGVHTASTAVGNYRVPAKEEGIDLGRISGMAPGARLAVYKACWGFSEDPAAGCASVDTAAAIEQAMVDGVDVINFSIGGSTVAFTNSVELAFLFAADAGVFVAASAGNEGPGPSTVAHNSPWVTTVAAGYHDRLYKGAKVVLGNRQEYKGVSLHDKGIPNSKKMILSTAAALAGADPAEAALCFPGTLDPAKVTGKIVVCDRGVNARVEKSQVVEEAGGVGMVLVNVVTGTIVADIHHVPTVHVDEIVGPKIKAYVSGTANPTGKLTRGELDTGNPAPTVAGFSSRGPANAGGGDLLKPDILAPGVDVLAAFSPVQTGRDFEFLSGTSMSSPHIAGLAALIRHAHPDWSPMAIKSALMTTATPRRNDFRKIDEFQANELTRQDSSPLAYGSGLVQASDAVDPGLVYDADFDDWFAFLCGQGLANCTPAEAIDASDLNYPSIAIGDLAFTQTVTRTVTNVSRHHSIYIALVDAPEGIKVDVSPRIFTIAPGQSKSYTVKFTTQAGANIGSYAFGSITWIDGRHQVRSPLAIRPVPLSAPAEVSGNGAPLSYDVQFGYTGPFTATPRGLIPATQRPGVVADDPDDDLLTGPLAPSAALFGVTIPAGTTYARFSLFDTHTTGQGGDDLDLYLLSATGTILAISGTATSNEEINLLNPTPGNYIVLVHGFETATGAPTNFTLFQWLLGSAAAGNMQVTAPANVTAGATGSIDLTFSGLSAGVKYLGSVAYGGAPAMPNPTIVRIDP